MRWSPYQYFVRSPVGNIAESIRCYEGLESGLIFPVRNNQKFVGLAVLAVKFGFFVAFRLRQRVGYAFKCIDELAFLAGNNVVVHADGNHGVFYMNAWF
jgi:hypothetical protein